MSNRKVDYSELVTAVQEGDKKKTNQLVKELLPRLKDYLNVVMNADENTAEECVHQAFEEVFRRIREDKIKNPKYIFSYLLKSCRHKYLHYDKRIRSMDWSIDEEPDYLVRSADQYKQLIDEERKSILKLCLQKLDEKARDFITYFLDKPEISTYQASKHFNISKANVRTKKSRILSRLSDCFKRHSSV